MRPIWSGAISFGLVNIPIRVYSASEEHALSFDMLHKTDLSPIRYARICKADGKEIPYQDIVKGYEYEKGEYVVVDAEDFKRANPRKTQTIEILDFVNEDEIDSVYYEKPYYLEPDKGAGKSYTLLLEAFKKSKKVGVVKFIFKDREHLGVLKPYKNVIALNQLRFDHELRNPEQLEFSPADVSKKELDMALKLISQLTDKFKPAAYKDTYIDELKSVIEDKVKGIKPRKKAVKPAASTKVHDIMSLLKASLDEGSKPKQKSSKKPKTAKSEKKRKAS